MVSHTATGEWQSFESRMRRRRAERLALRAEAAAAAGLEADARACLAEARTLAPDLPAIASLEASLVHQPEPLIAEPVPVLTPGPVLAPAPVSLPRPAAASAPRSTFVSLAAAFILIAAFVGGWVAYRDVPEAPEVLPKQVTTTPTQVTERTPAAAGPVAEPATASPPRPVPAAAAPASAAATDRLPVTATEPIAAPPSAVTAVLEPITRDRPSEPTSTAAPPPMATSQGLPALSDVAAAPLPAPSAARVEPPPVVTAAVPTTSLTDAVLRTPSVDVKAPVVEVAQEPRVQEILNRYASAYSALDADAAARVWPTVNRGALARAFDGLASQRVNLGDCSIDVSGTKARARCAGSATWSPKVGSGTHNESRVWTFDLVRTGADWQILNAHAQNR